MKKFVIGMLDVVIMVILVFVIQENFKYKDCPYNLTFITCQCGAYLEYTDTYCTSCNTIVNDSSSYISKTDGTLEPISESVFHTKGNFLKAVKSDRIRIVSIFVIIVVAFDIMAWLIIFRKRGENNKSFKACQNSH